MASYNEQYESIFIRESRSVRNKRIKMIIAVDLVISFLYGYYLYVLTMNFDFFDKMLGVVISLGIDAAIVASIIWREDKKFKSFANDVRNNYKDFFSSIEQQAVNAEKMFGAICFLDDYMYVCTQNMFIPYIDIRKIRTSIKSINFINVATVVHIYCLSGRVYSINLRSAGEYRRKQDEFEFILEQYRQRSFAKIRGQNMHYK